MSGTTVQLFSRRSFDFTDLKDSGSSEICIQKAVDVSQYTSGVLEVRVHDLNIEGTSIDVLAYTTAPTPEEPNVDFIDSTAVATVSVTSTDAAPSLLATSLSSNFGGMLAIMVKCNQAGVRAALAAELSAFLTLKS